MFPSTIESLPRCAGTHRVVFRYRGFRGYPLLFAISAGALLALLGAEVARPHTPNPATPVGSRTPLAHHPHTTHNPPPRSTDAARTAAPRGMRAIPTRHHDLPQEGAPPAAPPRRRNAKRCRPRQAEAARLRKPTLLVCRRFGPERPVPASCAARPKGAVGATVSLQMIASCPDVAGGGQPSGPSCVVKVSGR